jgi:glycosyltransferase involved in cell wall biosynthesis
MAFQPKTRQLDMNSTFCVSVVIPAYNEASRIDRSIQSVLGQTHPVDEIIVVDDGSTDGTAEVVAKYAGRVTCISQANQGQSATRNTGIRAARHEWVAFLDADDEWMPDHIGNALNVLVKYPDVVWYCAAFESRSESGAKFQDPYMDEKYLHDGVLDNYFIAQADTSFSCSSSMIVKRSVFSEAGMFNSDILHYGEDLDMWFRIALRYPKIGYSRLPGCIYWRRQGSITTIEKTTNIPRFMRRIEATYVSSSGFAGDVRRGSDYLAQSWVIYAIKYAIKQNEPQHLPEISNKFDALLPPRWKLICKVFQNPLAMELAHLALGIRNGS